MRKFIPFVMIFLFALGLFAQHTPRGKGRIQGVVLDQFGHPVEGVAIEAIHLESGFKRATKSGKEGKWAILGLGTGEWRITARAKGYFPSSTTQFVHQLRRNPDITLSLRKMSGLEALLSDNKAMKNLRKGNKLFEEGKYKEALTVFNKLIGKYPEMFELRINTGNIFYKTGDYQKAIQEFSLVAKQAESQRAKLGDEVADDIIAKAYAGVGNCYVKMKDLKKAKDYYEKSVNAYKNNAGVAFNLGELCYADGEMDRAIQMYLLASKLKPEWDKPYYKLGYAYLGKAEMEKSLEYFKKFLTIADEDSKEYKEVKGLIPDIESMIKSSKKQK